VAVSWASPRYARGVKMGTKQRIRAFLRKFMDEGSVEDTDNIFEKGLVNSLFAMQLVNFIENEFNVSFSNEEIDIDNFKDIYSIAAFVDSKL
jgi:methoxymalonate biosynthesis acyl carrier protein